MLRHHVPPGGRRPAAAALRRLAPGHHVLAAPSGRPAAAPAPAAGPRAQAGRQRHGGRFPPSALRPDPRGVAVRLLPGASGAGDPGAVRGEGLLLHPGVLAVALRRRRRPPVGQKRHPLVFLPSGLPFLLAGVGERRAAGAERYAGPGGEDLLPGRRPHAGGGGPPRDGHAASRQGETFTTRRLLLMIEHEFKVNAHPTDHLIKGRSCVL